MTSGNHGGARGDANQKGFFSGQGFGHVKGGAVFYGDDIVDDVQVEDVGYESGADALDGMDAGRFSAEDGRGSWVRRRQSGYSGLHFSGLHPRR